MYTQGSVEFNQIIETPNNKAIKSRLVLLDDNTIIDKIKSLILYSASCSQELQIGTTNMAYIDAEVESNLILTNREVRLECGVELSDGTVEYIPMGVFTIQKPQGDIDFVKFTANDRMQKFDYPYSSTLTYPTTDKAMLEELATMCGVALATNIDNPITIDKALDGYTRREVLGYIAGLHGKFACFNRNGELAMKWYNTDSPITKNIGLIWGFEKSDEDFTVSKIEVAKNNETTLTSGNGYGVVQHSNPLATQEIVNDLFTSLNGFTYNASVVDILDDIRLDLGDVIKVTYLDGKDYLVPCMSIKQDFTQGSTNIESFAKSDTENTYRFTGPTINYLNRMATELLLANRVIATKVDAEYVNSHAITTDNLDAIKAEIQTLIVDEIDGKYADIHLANIDILDVGQFFADSGIVRDMVIVDGKVTGVLDSVTINANNITSGTLTTDRLVIRGTNKSIVYELNNIDGALQAKDVDTLNGEIITPRTINADRIIAESITANELATESITSDKIVAGAITAEKLAVDAIMSNNYVADATGSFLNLEDGSFDSKYLKWDEYGKATITDLKVLNSLDVGSGGVYPDFIGRPTQWYMRANKYTGGYMSDIIHIGFETWDSLDNPTQIIDDTVVMSVYGGGQYGVEFPITVNAKNLNVYQMRAYEEKDKETGDILSRSGSIGVISSRFPKAYINEITCDDLNVDGSYQSGKGNINAQGYIRATKELISKGNLTVDGITTLNGNTAVKGELEVPFFPGDSSKGLSPVPTAGGWQTNNSYLVNDLPTCKTFIGSYYGLTSDSSTSLWQNVISVRHRNGSYDGSLYGMYIRSPLTMDGSLSWNKQYSGNWQDERYILDSKNYTGLVHQLSYFLSTSNQAVVPGTTINAIGYTGWENINLFGQKDGAIYKQAYDSSYQHEIYGDYRTGKIAVRGKNGGNWVGWRGMLDKREYGSSTQSLSVTLTKGYDYLLMARNKSGMYCAVIIFYNHWTSKFSDPKEIVEIGSATVTVSGTTCTIAFAAEPVYETTLSLIEI